MNALLLCALIASQSDDKLGIAVLNVQTSGDVPADIAPVLSGLISTKLDKSGVFRVVTEDDVKSMVSFDQMKTALSCDDQASCLSEIGQALGVPFMLTGTLAKLGDNLVLNLALVDIGAAKVQKRESATYADMNALTKGLDTQVERAVQALLYREKGRLLVTTTEEGATIEVDGVAIGTAPLSEQSIASGPHRITVSKQGFIQYVQDVVVQPKLQTVLSAKLVPSPEFLASYKARTGTTRTLAWGTTIAGASLAVVGGGLIASSFVMIELLRQEKGVTDPNESAVVTSLEATPIVAAQITGSAMLGLGALSGGGALFFWATGEDPDRYDHLVTGAE
jgi:TolB-like protein